MTKDRSYVPEQRITPAAKRPVFVLVETTVFSGATLLAFLLNSHASVASVGEMDGLIPSVDPDEYLCSCGQRIRACDFWHSVKIAMLERGFEFDVARFDTQFSLVGPTIIRYLRGGSLPSTTLDSIRESIFWHWPGEKQRLQALVARNVAFINSVLHVTGKEVFVDTSKHSNRLRLSALLRCSTIDIRAIHLVRDVRGSVASRLRRDSNLDVRSAAQQWIKWHRRIEGTLRALPQDKQTRVRYEDLCRDPKSTLEQLFRFCGVDPRGTAVDFRRTNHHIVGNQMRLETLSEVKLDERWKSQLTYEQVQEIDRVAAKWSQRYGYG